MFTLKFGTFYDHFSDKLNQHVVDQIATLPGFYDLNHMFESVKAGQNVLTRPAKIMLIRLQW